MKYADDKNPKQPGNPKYPEDEVNVGNEEQQQNRQPDGQLTPKPSSLPLQQPVQQVKPVPVQQQQSSHLSSKLEGKWKQQVGAAKINWGKLTEDELLKTEGHAQKLAGLVQERYAVTREKAEEQVKKFIDKNNH